MANNAGRQQPRKFFTTSEGGKPLEPGGVAPSDRRLHIVPPGSKVVEAALRDPNTGAQQLCFMDTQLGVHVTLRMQYYTALAIIDGLDEVCRTYENCAGMTRDMMREREPKPKVKYVRPTRRKPRSVRYTRDTKIG